MPEPITTQLLQDRKRCKRGNWKHLYKMANVDTLTSLYHSRNRTDRKRATYEIMRRQEKPQWGMGLVIMVIILCLFTVITMIWLRIPLPHLSLLP